jgi:hypothetical protein
VNFIGKTPWRGLQGAIGLAWPILGRLGRLDPGSNPGSPTNYFEMSLLGQNYLMDPQDVVSKLCLDEVLWDCFRLSYPNRILKLLYHLPFDKFPKVAFFSGT